MPKLSVIMPCLNVVNYIKECMESIINQTLKDIEIIVVDAGSTDGTLDILAEYQKKDNRVIILHSDVKSYGYQVNMGIDIAKGECVGIVDTDDIVDINAYSYLYKVLIENDLDYVKGYAKAFWNIKSERLSYWPICNFYIGSEMVNKVICPCKMPKLIVNDHFLWQGIYKKELLKDIRLNETPGAAFQDQGFCLQVFMNATRAMYVDYCVYYYRQDNVASSTFSTRGFEYTYQEFMLNKHYLKDTDSYWKKYFYARMLDQCIGRYNNMMFSKDYCYNVEEDILNIRRSLIEAEKEYNISEVLSGDNIKRLELLTDGPRVLYDYMKKDFDNKRRQFKEIYERLRGKKIVIVSSGLWARFFFELLDDSISVLGFADNNSDLWESHVDQYIINSLNYFANYDDVVYVIANKYHYEELIMQLNEIGISNDRILVYKNGIDFSLFKR